MPNDTEKSEMLTVYDENLNPVGERTRAEVHEQELLHRTVRLWAVEGDRVWFQRRAMTKKLFPGRYDLAATGHVDPGESTGQAALRELGEETGLSLSRSDIVSAGSMPFPFRRPDGKLDNEFASIYVYKTETTPPFRNSDEVDGLASMALEDYAALVRFGTPAPVETYVPGPDGGKPVLTGTATCCPEDFCCPNVEELKLVAAVSGMPKIRNLTGRDPGKAGEIARSIDYSTGPEKNPEIRP